MDKNITFELNNVRKDSDYFSNKFHKGSIVSEVFSAMVQGKDLEKWGKKADQAVNYIKGLGERAVVGDPYAISELNTLRRFVVESPIMEEVKLLSVFGTYENVGFDETIEREVYTEVGEHARAQATNGDVVFPTVKKEVYPVPTFTVSGGYEVDYRRVQKGDMTFENRGMEHVRTSIMNQAKAKILMKVYNAIKNATGVKYIAEMAGLTKTGADGVINNVRRNGRPTVIGDYSMISQFTPWAGYVGSISNTTITGVSDDIINEVARNGALSMYNGAILAEMPNPYNFYQIKADGSNFETLLPQGLALVVPTGVQSPIATFTRGGLTTMSGNNVSTGQIMSRFDLEVGVDIAKGHEHKIGVLWDTNISPL